MNVCGMNVFNRTTKLSRSYFIFNWNIRDVKNIVINKERSVEYLRDATSLFSSKHGLYKGFPFFLDFSSKVLGNVGLTVSG